MWKFHLRLKLVHNPFGELFKGRGYPNGWTHPSTQKKIGSHVGQIGRFAKTHNQSSFERPSPLLGSVLVPSQRTTKGGVGPRALLGQIHRPGTFGAVFQGPSACCTCCAECPTGKPSRPFFCCTKAFCTKILYRTGPWPKPLLGSSSSTFPSG